MKKLFNYAMLGAIALAGATGLTACSSSDDAVVEKNPTYDPATNSVTTQFVLNVSSATNGTTRQSATTVQKDNNFRGIQNAMLISMTANKATSFLAPYFGETSGITNIKSFDLGTLYAANAVTNDNADNDENSTNRNSSSHRVIELTLPLTTDAMLVYGRAIKSGTEEENGSVEMTINTTEPSNTTFKLVPRVGEDATAYEQTCNLAALILNRIMKTSVAENLATGTKFSRHNYEQVGDLSALSWVGLGTATGTLAPLQDNLRTVYKAITTYGSDEIRSGSAASICSMMKDAYSVVKSVYDATATTDDELNAQRLANEIIQRIGNYFDAEDADFPFKALGSTTETNSIIQILVSNNFAEASAFTGSGAYAKVTNDYFKNFPVSFKLPAGVSQLYFETLTETAGSISGNGFSYKNPSQSLIEISKEIKAEKYMYPSELLYFDNSLLRVTDAEKDPDDYPNGYNKWDTDTWTGWTTGKVSSSTRSVAVKNNINYGVAMLQAKVALDGTSFQDNRQAIVTTEENQVLEVDDVKKFTLTGILIGGQYKELGWNYLTTGVGTDNKDFVIYDNQIPGSGTIPTATGEENYTLVFDNWTSESSQEDVLIALEFKNGNEKDFYGKGNMIPKGGTFYLVGKLELGSNTISTWDTYYPIPPYTNDGASTQTSRIFTQDYMTTATFKIGAESLKNAYNTVPDLRASQTSLGLSVDLKWQPGISFENVILGQ